MKTLKKCLVLGLAGLLSYACSKGSLVAPSAVEKAPVVAQEGLKLSSSAFDTTVKQRSSFSLEGNTLTWHAKNPTGSAIGPFWLIVFNHYEQQFFLAASGPFILEPGGGDFEVQFQGCGIRIQADAYLSPTLTEAMKGNQFAGGYLLDADWLAVDPCSPRKPPVDVCPNLEGVQKQMPEGFTLNEQGDCVRNACDLVASSVASEPCPSPSPTPTPSPSPSPEPTPSPSPSPEPSPSPSPTPSPEPTPDPQILKFCYYEVAGNDNPKHGSTKGERCEGEGGTWGAWYSNNGGDHEQCRIPFPGKAKNGFNLNPGQSADGCLSKHDN